MRAASPSRTKALAKELPDGSLFDFYFPSYGEFHLLRRRISIQTFEIGAQLRLFTSNLQSLLLSLYL